VIRLESFQLADKFDFPVSLYFAQGGDFLVYENESTLRYNSLFMFGKDYSEQIIGFDKNGKAIAATNTSTTKPTLFGLSKSTRYTIKLEYENPERLAADEFRRLMVKYLDNQKEPTANNGKLGMEGISISSDLNVILERVTDYAVVLD
jgi:hypothetical protein